MIVFTECSFAMPFIRFEVIPLAPFIPRIDKNNIVVQLEGVSRIAFCGVPAIFALFPSWVNFVVLGAIFNPFQRRGAVAKSWHI
jgi:hypothetical protein